jgi:hypothetical protein
VRGGAAGADPPLLDIELVERVDELVGAKLGAVVADQRLQPPAGRSKLAGTRRTSAEQCFAAGFFGLVCSSAQAKLEATSIAVYCQTLPLVPESRPT